MDEYIQRYFSLNLYCRPSAHSLPARFLAIAINDDSDNKSYSDLSDSDTLWGVTSTYTK